MSTYQIGTVTVNNGSTAATGSGTSWDAVGIRAGDFLFVNGLFAEVASVQSNTALTLVRGWPGANASGQQYSIALIDDGQRSIAALNQVLQALGSGTLTSLAGLSAVANEMPYWTGVGVMGKTALTSQARTLLGSSLLSRSGNDYTFAPEANVAIQGGTIDGTPLGQSEPAPIEGTSIVGSTGQFGSLETDTFQGFNRIDVYDAIIDAMEKKVSKLFATNEPGVWLDPSDITTLFQDTAGLVPVTAPGQSVARMNDKSGNDNHATQATAAARPVYGIVPMGGRRNLLTRTEEFDNAVWASDQGPSLTPQGDGVWRLQASPSAWTLQQSMALNSLLSVFAIDVKSNNAGLDRFRIALSGTLSIRDATPEWQRVQISRLHNVNTTVNGLWHNLEAGIDILIRFPQFEIGEDPTPYQRVGSQFDVTEDGVPSLGYLSFNGVNQWMVTPTITPGTDKAQVFAGVRKLSGSSTGLIVEMSQTVATNNGAINLVDILSTNNWHFNSKGTIIGNAMAAAIPAPASRILTGLGDVAGDIATLRVDGIQAGQSTADQGTGNYLAYPLFVGARAGNSLFLTGHIHQLIARFGPNLSEPEIERAERYVAAKTAGVTL